MNRNSIRNIFYSLIDGVYNLKRGGITGIISMITIAFTLVNLGLFFLLWFNLSPMLEGWTDQVKVQAYLKDGIPYERIEELKGEIMAAAHVKDAFFVSKSEAMERFKESLGEDMTILEGIEENPLPASFDLVVDERAGVAGVEDVVKAISSMEEFEEVQSGGEWVKRLSAFLFIIKIVGFFIGGVLVFMSLFIISNTVRLTFINRNDEIEIMRLMGANRLFIKAPFFIEGLLNGLIGGIISVGFLFLLYQGIRYKLSPFLLDTFGMIRLSFIPFSSVMLLVCLGMGVGGVGSLFSLRL